MSWNHRILKRKYGNRYYYGIYEVYYESGEPHSSTEDPIMLSAENLHDLKWLMNAIRVNTEVLNYEGLTPTGERIC